MRKILVAVVLGLAAVAPAQNPAPPAQHQGPAAALAEQAQPAGQAQRRELQEQSPVIKDPAEYNAYVVAVQATDPNARISGLEAFLNQYPNSVIRNQALEILMQMYQQTNNAKKALETGTKLVASDPCNLRALTLMAYLDRVLAQGGDPNAQQLLGDGKKYGEQGLECLPKATDPEIAKMKDAMAVIFQSAIGLACLQNNDNARAVQQLKPAVEGSPDAHNDFSLVYPLALAYLGQNPPDFQNGIWYAARAAAVAPGPAQPQIEKYARSQYVKFHAGDDGWNDFLTAARSGGPQVPVPPAPTPADQAHKMVLESSPDKMDFATWEFILINGSQEDQGTVWNAIKGKAVQMNGAVISTTATEFQIAGSSDDIDAKKADITLKFEDKVPARLIPKDGASLDFQGEPVSYTSDPFMVVMEKGMLLKAKTAPAITKKPPARRKPAA